MNKITISLARWFKALVHHYSLHEPEHVGQFAGSLVPMGDWQHH
jgi:hypothetical protein